MLDNGIITSIYCHFDGYPSSNGKILLNKYKTKTQVEDLILGGNLSSLGTLDYYTKRGESYEDNAPSTVSLENIHKLFDGWIEYVYVFDCNSSKWNILKNSELQELTMEMCK